MILVFRPLKFIFYKNWYSVYRWTHPTEYENTISHLIDFGFLTIGYKVKLN